MGGLLLLSCTRASVAEFQPFDARSGRRPSARAGRPRLRAADLGVLRESVQFGVRAWIGSLTHLLNARTDQIISTEATLGICAVAVNSCEPVRCHGTAAGRLLSAIRRSASSARLRVYRANVLLTLMGTLGAAALVPV